jgi:6-phosphofructo-2-kinase/fructose-2,6-biphosphatase
MDDDSLAYVKVIDIGRKIILNRISSALPSKIVLFLMNLHNTPRRIFLTRHGQSEFNQTGRIGGDSPLTKLGDDYAHILAEWTLTHLPVDTGSVTIYTSSMRRTIQTTQYIPCRKIRLKLLDEINAGDFDGMTYQQIADQFPEEYAARAADKLRYRYPRGESYLDLIQRVEPIMFELERQKQDVIVVAHQAVLRCLYAYFTDLPLEDCPFVQIPLHTMCVYVKEERRDAAARGSITTAISRFQFSCRRFGGWDTLSLLWTFLSASFFLSFLTSNPCH